MKYLSLMLVILAISACKVEPQNSQESKRIESNGEDQVVISGTNLNSNEVEKFSTELEQKQRENPDKFFEVVKESNRSGNAILSKLSDDALYPKKNFYLLIGLGRTAKDDGIQKTDWDAVYYIMTYLSEQKYRVLVNVRATSEHLRFASQDKDTAVILWSSHGNKTGFYDVNGERVPYDIFKNKSRNFHQLVLSSCEGRIALNNHYAISALKTYAWEGLTNSAELKSFLVSDEWTSDYGKSLTTPNAGITCTAEGKKFILMKDSSRIDLYGYGFDSLESCADRVKSIKNNRVCSSGERGVFAIDTNTLTKVQEFNSLEECL